MFSHQRRQARKCEAKISREVKQKEREGVVFTSAVFACSLPVFTIELDLTLKIDNNI